MELAAEHRFPGPPAAVAAVLAERAFYEELALPDLRLDTVVAAGPGEQPGEHVLVLRYEYTGGLDPLARRLLGGARLTWLQELHLRPEGRGARDPVEGLLQFRSEARPELLHGEARFRLTVEGRGAVRRLTGTVVVALPVIGRVAEQRIVPGVLARLDVEAGAVARRLEGDGAA